MDTGMNQLLQWSIENSDVGRTNPANIETNSTRGLNAEALAALMGGPSDADLMKESMTVIQNPDVALNNKVIAFDNFEQLVENIDNANNLEALGLWTPLVEQLSTSEADMRRLAAWCIGTAVQNNTKAQERMLVVGAIPKLVELAVHDKDAGVRRKAVYALSSEVRNYQPGLEALMKHLPKDIAGNETVKADDMEAIDKIMTSLREREV